MSRLPTTLQCLHSGWNAKRPVSSPGAAIILVQNSLEPVSLVPLPKLNRPAIKVIPGELGKGIYVTLSHHDNEEYHISHCNAYIQGWLTGSLYLSLQDRVVISCPKSNIRAIYDFKPEVTTTVNGF